MKSLHPAFEIGLGPAPQRYPAAPAHHLTLRNNASFTRLLCACALTHSPSLHAQSEPASSGAAAPLQLERSSTSTSTSAELEAFLAHTQTICGHAPRARRFSAAVRVELSTGTFTQPDAAITHLVRCNVDQGVLTLRLQSRELTLDVSDVPPSARARTLAVALAETLRLPPTETAAASLPPADVHSFQPSKADNLLTQVPPPDAPRRSSIDVAPPKTQAAGWQLPVTLRALALGPRRTLAWGATLGASQELFEGVRVGAHLGYLTAHDRSALGDARMHAVSIEGTIALRVVRPTPNTTLDVGASAALYEAVVVVDSAWGVDEPDANAWFALWGLHAELSTAVGKDLRLLTHLRAVKDIAGRRLRAGGHEAMSFYGIGAELRLGAAYAW